MELRFCKPQKSGLMKQTLMVMGVLSFFPSLIYAQGYVAKVDPLEASAPSFTLKPYRSWDYNIGVDARFAFHHLYNVVHLDSANKSDKTSYFGASYDFTFDFKHVSGAELYILLQRKGRADYDAPIAGDRKIHSLFGDYKWYRNADLSPRVRGFFVQAPLNPAQSMNLKAGLMPYGREVGHGIALGGKYENYGSTLSGNTELVDWNIHWEKEDIANRIHLGAVVDNDKPAAWHHSSSYFSAADATLKLWDHRWQFYVGWLRDATGSNRRGNLYLTPTQIDDLITPGQYLQLKFGHLNLGFEAAKNVGKANGDGAPTIYHEGYLLVGDASYDFGFFKPRAKMFVASGNKFAQNNAFNAALPGTKNRAFSVFSPTNTNLTYSHYQKENAGPFLFMAGGYAVNFGIPRPGTFGDPHLYENIVTPNIGFDFTPFKKVYLGVDYWYLMSKEYGYGLDRNSNVIRLPKFLGQEVDLFASYQLTPKIKLSLLTGYFFPGDYYRVVRTDSLTQSWAPSCRGDGKANDAYQVEMAVEIKY